MSKRNKAPESTLLPVHAFLLSVKARDQSDHECEVSQKELAQLVQGLGVTVVDRTVIRRPPQKPKHLLGEGQVEELKTRLGAHLRDDAELVVVVDTTLTQGQHRMLETELELPVLDRTGVILQVFEQRASTHMARLEVELARLAYDATRIREDKDLTGKEGGGGGRGERGHTNVELRKMRLKDLAVQKTRELEALRHTQDRQRQARDEVCQVALVGYTNAGKSSLMRALTGSEVLVEDKLFATLGTTVRTLAHDGQPRVLVSDTVGFIRNLPHDLIGSFRSTLAEARDAGLLLLVVDASDPEWRAHLEVTRETLAAIDAGDLPTQVVFNKIDRLSDEERAALRDELPDAVQMSAFDAEGVESLKRTLLAFFEEQMASAVITVPYAEGKLLGEIHESARVLETSHTEEGTVLRLQALPRMLDRIRARVG